MKIPQAATPFDCAAASRPRRVRDAIVLGTSSILARRAVECGCYCVERPEDDALAALLSLAYEKRISRNDPMVRAVLRAADGLLRSPEHVDVHLAHLPEPSATAQLPQAECLLKAGARPADLEGVLRRDRLGLREAPAYAERPTLCDKGVVLGTGTVIAALEDLPGGGTGLALNGREERILALLSVASDQAIGAGVLSKFEAASRALSKGDVTLAAIHLVHAGLPPLAHTGFAKALSIAAAELDRGAGPFELMKGLDLLPVGMRYADWSLRKFNPNHVGPGCPEGGQFCSADDSGNSGQAKPDENTASIIPVAAQADSVQAMKEKFVTAHLLDAQKVADQLGVPVENILGLSALESGWGSHRFAFEGNNYFGLHYPAPGATGYMDSDKDGPMATFTNYADSLKSFVDKYGDLIRGQSEPATFAAALQNSGKFGVNPDGSKVSTYVPNTAATIAGLRSVIDRVSRKL